LIGEPENSRDCVEMAERSAGVRIALWMLRGFEGMYLRVRGLRRGVRRARRVSVERDGDAIFVTFN